MLHRVALRWVFLAVVAAGVAGACSSGTGSSGSPPAGTASAPADPGQWIGTITYRFAGNATGQRDEDNGYSYPGTYDDNATYTVVLGRDSSTSSGVSWSVVSGTATGSVNDDLLEINQGTTQRTTWNGQDSVGMPQGSCRLSFSTNRRSYSIECTRVRFDNVQWVNYEPNDPGQIYDGPNTGIWFTPQFSLTDMSMPAQPTGLTGSRKATVWVQTASGPDVQVQADVSWDLTPGSGTA